MSEIAAVICEYNPFHLGHQYQLNEIRKDMSDAVVIAIMSGNVTQRGEFAFMDKYMRANAAVACGVDAVFELPYPYCASAAEIFAKSGVSLAESLGSKHLYFGTESDTIENLEKIARTVDMPNFEEKIAELAVCKRTPFLEKKEQALSFFGFGMPQTANDILAVEYIRAVISNNYSIKCHGIKRMGAGYNDKGICDMMSASAIREKFYDNRTFLSVPNDAKVIYQKSERDGAVLDINEARKFVYRYIISSDASRLEEAFDSGNGIGHFISDTAKKSSNYNDFFERLTAKSFTYARLRRIVMYALFGIREINEMPAYTVLLAANTKGRTVIKNSHIPVITKLADAKKLDPVSEKQFEISHKTDELYCSLIENPVPVSSTFKMSPFII